MKRRVAVVTGGAKGIGRACCEALLRHGDRVLALDIDDAAGETLALAHEGEPLHYFHCDVSSPESVEAVCDEMIARFGVASVLVNNAGIQTHRLFLEMTPQEWHQTLSVNLDSAFYTCKRLLPAMVAQGFGRVINISSMSARRGSMRHTHYCTSKAGLLGLTRALSTEVARSGVTVNAICPGIVETDIVQETLAQKREGWLQEMHVKRLGTPADIANAVLFLASDASGWISGQAFDINGGILTP